MNICYVLVHEDDKDRHVTSYVTSGECPPLGTILVVLIEGVMILGKVVPKP